MAKRTPDKIERTPEEILRAAGGTTEHRAPKPQSSGNGAADPFSHGEFPEPEWPEPLGFAAQSGLAGEFIAKLMSHTEADTAALLFQFLAMFGNVIGAGPHYEVENSKHAARLNVVLVGRTSKGRRGTSYGRVRALFRLIDPTWVDERIASGLSTSEGLIYQVRDERRGRDNKGEEIVLDSGETDKRFLVVSSEFAGVLRIMERIGNTLSSTIRDAWDQGTLRTLTKADPLIATGAHISQIGHVTADELRRRLDETEAANGFCNRILFACVRRAAVLPDGGGFVDWEPFAARLNDAVTGARKIRLVSMDQAAHDLWHQVYPRLSEAKPGLFGAIIARAEAQVIRLALIYALLDQSQCIREEHLQAGLECWRYAEQSARFVFGDKLGDPIADTIMAALRQAPDGMSRPQILEIFGRNVEAGKLASGLQVLVRAGLVRSEERPGRGRTALIWKAS